MSIWSKISRGLDYVPFVSNAKGALTGNLNQAAWGSMGEYYKAGKGAYNKIGGLGEGGGGSTTQPGVGGKAKNPANLVQQRDGSFFDPTTGTSYTDATGQQSVANPNVAQQVAQANARSRSFLGGADEYNDRERQAYGQQQALLSSLGQQADGLGPSVAGAQMARGLDATNAQQLSAAAGANGTNAGMARLQAMRNMGAANAATTANAGVARAAEAQGARQQQAGLLTAMQGQNAGMANANLTAGENFSQQALSGQAANQGLNMQGQQIQAQQNAAMIQAGGTALAAYAMSDERAKENISHRDLADSLGERVHGVEFDYKPGAGQDGQRHFGVLAQELEHVMPGVVERGADGMRRVNTGHLTLGNTALLAELDRRLRRIEGNR